MNAADAVDHPHDAQQGLGTWEITCVGGPLPDSIDVEAVQLVAGWCVATSKYRGEEHA